MTEHLPPVDARIDRALDAMRAHPSLPTHGAAQVAARAVLANTPMSRARNWTLRAAAAVTIVATGTAAITSARLLSRSDAVAQPVAALTDAAETYTTPTLPAVSTAARPIVFELDAPNAHSVQVLGDFNQWSRGATSMQRSSDGRWRMTTMLPPGRYVYAFLVDGRTFRRDPQRDAVPDRDFGVTGSELVVGEAP